MIPDRWKAPAEAAPLGPAERGEGEASQGQAVRSVPRAGTGLWGVSGATYDVFGPDGRYLVSLAAPGRARLQAASGDTVWALRFVELDQASVVAYELGLEEEGP